MRFAHSWSGRGVAAPLFSLSVAVLLAAPGCGSGAATGTGPMLKDAAPAPPGQQTSASYHRSQKDAAPAPNAAAQGRARRGQR